MIDRLEQAGYVRRVPDPTDRRRVVVELVPEKMEAMEATMARYGDKSAAEMKRYSDAELAVINDFLTRMADVTRDEANALRDAPDREASAPSEYAAPIGGLSRARLLFRSGANELLLRGSTDFEDLYRAKFDGPVPQVRLRDGIVSIQYKGRLQWDWRERRADVALNAGVPWDVEVVGGANKLQGKLAPVDLRSFEMTGGVDQLRLTLGQPDRRRPDPTHRWGEPRPLRAADRRPRPAAPVGRHGGRRVRRPEARRDGRAVRCSRRPVRPTRPIGTSIEVIGGANRIIGRRDAGELTRRQRWAPPVSEMVSPVT